MSKQATINDVKEFWNENYSYISLEISDNEIQQYLDKFEKLEMVCNLISDSILASGDGDVQE